MKIIQKEKNETTNFGSLDIGSWFSSGGVLFIKIGRTCAFHVKDHNVCTFDRLTMVLLHKATEPKRMCKFEDVEIGSYFACASHSYLKIKNACALAIETRIVQDFASDVWVFPFEFVPVVEIA